MFSRKTIVRSTAALLLAATAGVAVAPAPTRAAAAAPDAGPTSAASLGENAALRYWPAFHFLPPSNPENDKVLDNWRTTAANDPAAAKLLAGSSLRYLHEGAKQQRVDWGLDYSQGFALLLPHAGLARNLSHLARLRAHQRALGGDPAGAVDDIADAMVLARHVSSDGILITILVRYAIEDMLIDLAGGDLLSLKGPELDRLAARLEQLPPSASAKDSVRIEREFGQKWAAKEVRSWAGKPDLANRLAALFGSPGDGNAAPNMDEVLRAGGGTAEGVAAKIEALGPVYDDLAAALALPREEARKRVAEVRKRAEKNPFAGLLLPAYERVIDVEARATTRMALLKAAIAIVQGGEGKLKDFKDPFGTGPFEYEAADGGGFELRSKLVVKDKPVTLRVGMPAKPKTP